MGKTILTKRQQSLLQNIAAEKKITTHFVLSGGTALAEYYLHHRLSEDLDFFAQNEIDVQYLHVFFAAIKKKADFQSIEYTQSFNRNLFFLHFNNEVLKLEFTFFPFPPIEQPRQIKGVFIDNLIDIAVNKLFTIYQKPRSRDFIDLYYILKKKKWDFEDVKKKAQIKFETYLDPIQLGSRCMQATTLFDYPRVLEPIDHTQWQQFFIQKAKELGENVIES